MHNTTMETYHGYVRTPADAIKLFEACRIGMLPRVQRRLSEKERQAIRSGSVFVWDEREAGMRRWTDGKSWSASRVSGSFLTYREMEGKRGSGFGARRGGAGKTPDSGRGSDEDQDDGGPDGYRYKADGLMKQSFSITTSAGQNLHLISYFSRNGDQLPQPTSDPNLRNIVPSKQLYPESSLNETPVPALTRSPMQQPYPPHPHAPHPHAHPHAHPQAHPQAHPHAHSHAHPHAHPGHHPGYPAPYQQPYWPPSPVATPPYSHGHYAPGPQHGHGGPPLPPPPHHYPQTMPYPPPGNYYANSGPPQPPYDRAPLPPPQPSALPPSQQMPLPQPYPQQPGHRSPHMAQLPPRLSPLGSPQSQSLQSQAREAVQIDPRLASSLARSPQRPLPALVPPSQSQQAPQQQPQQQTQQPLQQSAQQQQNGAQTPPSRTLSVSPPRSSHSDSKGPATSNPSNRASLQALLHHPTPSSSEPNSANPGSTGSANSSPRAATGNGPTAAGAGATPIAAASQSKRLAMEDKRTLSVLDKKFCI